MSERVLFEETLRETHAWLAEIGHELDVVDPHKVYGALKAVLHALRDRLTVEEAAHLGAQLPTLVRGAYYEGFRPGRSPEAGHTRKAFLDRVASSLRDPTVDPERAARAVFAVLGRHVSRGEIEDVRQNLPESIRELWQSIPG